MLDKTHLRQSMRRTRQALNASQQQEASMALTHVLADFSLFKNSQHIAFYLANGGEINPHPLVEAAWRMGISCYLPVLAHNGDNQLIFARYTQQSILENNRYGIPEPKHTSDTIYPAQALDLVFVPLVAVDTEGNRLGMGRGYYDRAFAFLKRQPRPQKPTLIGLAHSFQIINEIKPSEWDVPLQGTASEHELTLFS